MKGTRWSPLFIYGVSMTDLFRAVKIQAALSKDVIVAFSGGKDSVAVLDICSKHFEKVHVFFMYQVPGLSFQEDILNWAENRYGVEILRIPHFQIYPMKKYGVWCAPDDSVPEKGVNEVYDEVRDYFGCKWIAAGERIADSLWRRGFIKRTGTVDCQRLRFYPIAEWNKAEVLDHIRCNKLRYAPETKYLGGSFQFRPKVFAKIKEYYPEDFEKIKRYFPYIEGTLEYSKRLNDEK